MSTRILNDGTLIPTIAFGTGTKHYHRDASEAVLLALKEGFGFIDTANEYANEESVGKALKAWGGKREDVYISSKWGLSDPQIEHDAEVELQNSLRVLGTNYLDLYLLHIPNTPGISNKIAWEKMEDFKKRGLVRSIGLSNYRAEEIEDLSKIWKVKPVVNQVQYHPLCFNHERVVKMVEICKKHDISISPYRSLTPFKGFPGGSLDPAVERIGSVHQCTPAQILLAWARQYTQGGPVISTATKEWQYSQILGSKDIILTKEEMEEIETAGKEEGNGGEDTLEGLSEVVV